MKKLFFILLTILFAKAYSQEGFYLHPIIPENKSNVNPGHPYDIITPQGYILHVRPLNFYNYYNWYDIGLHIGYRTKNLFFETGWTSDGANAGVRITAMTYPNAGGGGYADEIGNAMGIVYNKYPLRMGVKLFGKDSASEGNSIRWQCFLYGGIDLLRRPGTGVVIGYGHDFIINPAKQEYVQYASKAEVGEAKSYLTTIGFMLKAYNKRGRNIVSLGVHYSQGHDVMAWNSMKFTNYDGTVYWGTPVRSKGSGLYINLSKDIYPANFFRKKGPPKYSKMK